MSTQTETKNVGHRWKAGDPSPNPKGRPKKGDTLADLMRKFLNKKTTIKVENQSMAVKRKEAFLRAVFAKAMKGDVHAQRLIWNYYDGMPQQALDVTSGGEQIEPLLIYLPEQDNGGLETPPRETGTSPKA